ncbi:MAG: NagC family transcriptional regulator [Thermoprotei archaeon]|nr:MAG: NagC family transcriptional regulator [Thermoprotei archaeon]
MRPLSPREFRRLAKRLGIKVEELKDVEKVSIVLSDKVIEIINPSVSVMTVSGNTIYQVVGGEIKEVEREKPVEEIEISEEDIQLVAEQAGVSLEEAKMALMETKGDLAKAIMLLTSRKAQLSQ